MLHSFAKNLTYYRKAARMTKAEMASILGITPAAYGFYESGRNEPKLDVLCKIAEVLQLDINRLLFSVEDDGWVLLLKKLVDDISAFSITAYDSETISFTRSSMQKMMNLKFAAKPTAQNTLRFRREDIFELYLFCTNEIGVGELTDSLKKYFFDRGLATDVLNYSPETHKYLHFPMEPVD